MSNGKDVGRILLVALAALLVWSAAPALQAAEHVVATSQMTVSLDDQATTRAERIAFFQEVLDAPEARAQAEAVGVDVARLKAAVPHLSDQELADLELRAAQAQDPAAGHRRRVRERHAMNPTYIILIAGVVVLTLLLLVVAD